MSRRWLIVLLVAQCGCGSTKLPAPAGPVASVPASLVALERIDLAPIEPIVVRQPAEISDDVVAKLRVYRDIADVPFAAFLAGLAIPEHPERLELPERSQVSDDGDQTVCEITIHWGKLEELPEHPAFNIQADEGNVLVSIQGEFVFEYTVIVAEDGEYSLEGRGFELPAVCRRRETFGEALPDLLHAACQHAAVEQMELLRNLRRAGTDDITREAPRHESDKASPGAVSPDDATISFDLASKHPGRRLTGRAVVRQLVGTMELGCRTGRSDRPILEESDEKNAIEAEKIFSAEVQFDPVLGGEAGERLAKKYGLNILHPKLTLGYDAGGSRAVVFAGSYAPAWRSMRSRPDERRLSDFADLVRDMLQCYLTFGTHSGSSG